MNWNSEDKLKVEHLSLCPMRQDVKEFWDRSNPALSWVDLDDDDVNQADKFYYLACYKGAAEAIAKQEELVSKYPTAEDDGFIPCTFEDIRKGDTVERTMKGHDGTTVVTTGVADEWDEYQWRSKGATRLAHWNQAGQTLRRKPAPVVHPEPMADRIVRDDKNGAPWAWDVDLRRYYPLHQAGPPGRRPEEFTTWTPMKLVEDEEDE